MKQKSRIRTDESRGYTRAGNSIGGHPVGPYLLRYCSTRGYPIRGYPIGCYPIRSYLKIYPITYPLEGYPIKYYPVGGYLKRGYLIKKLSYRTIKGYPSTLPVTPSASPPPTHTPATCNAQKKKKKEATQRRGATGKFCRSAGIAHSGTTRIAEGLEPRTRFLTGGSAWARSQL